MCYYNPLHRSRRFINQYFRLTDQNAKLFTRNHVIHFSPRSTCASRRKVPGCVPDVRVEVPRDLNTDVSVFDLHARLGFATRWRLAVAKGLRENCRDVGRATARKIHTVNCHRSGQHYLKSGGPTYI